MNFFGMRNTYSAQIRAWSLIYIQIGFTVFGLALSVKRATRRLPILHIEIWRHTGNLGMRRTGIWICRHGISYQTKGSPKGHWRTDETGWKLR